MRLNNNKNNYNNHILTRDERLFYQRLAIEGTQKIIAECLTRYEKGGNMFALKLALDGNVQIAEMLRNMKQHYGSVEEALSKNDYDYGR